MSIFSSSKLYNRTTAVFGFTRTSYLFFSSFLLVVFLIGYVWWPLAEEYLALIDWNGPWWQQLDWLLIGIFAVMSLLVMAHADLKKDSLILFVGLGGGFVIESWGTQTELWTYYTLERPPLWIIPAWPIASLSIDRLARLLEHLSQQLFPPHVSRFTFHALYWLIFPAFFLLMFWFVWPTLGKSLTIAALFICTVFILIPTNPRYSVLTFIAGSGLGYFLEVWGTTRQCWTYYTLQTPPLFAVMAHGMAAVAFWRCALLLRHIWEKKRTVEGK